jgi:ribosomal protein S12 methylthiotransferase
MKIREAKGADAPKIGIVSLGCPKALVDSERILTRLRAEGYDISPRYDGADAVIVNTCGFLDSAKAESLEAIGEAIKENGKVIVTGCMGADAGDAALIREKYPSILALTGPHQYEAVMAAVHESVTQPHDPFLDLVPAEGLHLTPRHYAYLKISEGCSNRCTFCIIPHLRGDLESRPVSSVLKEAERLAVAGVKELLVISQDTSAYGQDLKYAAYPWYDREVRTRFVDLCRELANLDVWIRLHYVYPYPHVDEVIPLMAEGRILPYLDIPFQHAAPSVLKAMRRPAAGEKTLTKIAQWRRDCPPLALRSSFIVGFPGETEADFQLLLDWLKEAKLDRVGCFKYEAVRGAVANELPDAVPEEVKTERWERLMETQKAISAERLREKVGWTLGVLIDEVDEDGAIGRSYADAPEIDGSVFLNGETKVKPGDLVDVVIEHSDDYDLWGSIERVE